jgi:hypothetical protein
VREITCNCGHRFGADLPELVDLDREPEALDSILSGSFMSVTCPKCETILKPDIPVRILWGSNGLDLYLVPEKRRSDVIRDRFTDIPSGESVVVVGYPELVEKLRVIESGLNDRIIEILKFYLLDRATLGAEREVRILFERKSSRDLVFHIHGLERDRICVSRIPMETYEKAGRNLDARLAEEPFASLLKPPYISINKIYSEDMQ